MAKEKPWMPRQTWHRKPHTQIIDSGKRYQRQKIMHEDRNEVSEVLKETEVRTIKLWIDSVNDPPDDSYKIIDSYEQLDQKINMHRQGNINISEIVIGDRLHLFNAWDVADHLVAKYGVINIKGVKCPPVTLHCSFSTDKIVAHLKQSIGAKVKTGKATGKDYGEEEAV